MNYRSIYHILGLHTNAPLCTRVRPGGVGTGIPIFWLIQRMKFIAYYTDSWRVFNIIIRGFLVFRYISILVIDTHPIINSLFPSEIRRIINE